MIIDYTTRAERALQSMSTERADEIRRGIDKLKDKPHHPASYAMDDTGNLRKAMVREGVLVEYIIIDQLLVIVVLELFDVYGYLDEED